jgi:CRS1 / YhbY (CRM) domain
LHDLNHNEGNCNFNLPISEDKPHHQLQVEFVQDTSYAAVAALSSPENQTTSRKVMGTDSLPQQASLPSESAHQIQTSVGDDTVSGKPTTLKRVLLRGNASANVTPILPDHSVAEPTVSLPWVRENKVITDARDQNNNKLRRKRSNTEMAEQMIPELELQRLRDSALRMKERMKVGSAGVTEVVVQAIHNKWKEEEVVKLRFEGPPSLQMMRTHQILEVHKPFYWLLLFIW